MTSRLAGKTVFITGAARGIGEHIARRVFARGGRPFLAGLESDRMGALAAEIGAPWFECDVTDQAGLDAAAAHAVEQTGGIDVVVANDTHPNHVVMRVEVSDTEDLERFIDAHDRVPPALFGSQQCSLGHVDHRVALVHAQRYGPADDSPTAPLDPLPAFSGVRG